MHDCSTTALPTTILVAVFLFGIAYGLLLCAWIIHLRFLVGRHIEKKERLQKEKAALSSLDETPIEIDDVFIMCPLCRQERHPGEIWWRDERILCAKHQMKDVSQTSLEERRYVYVPG